MDETLKKELQPIYEQVGSIVQASQQMEYSIILSLTILKQFDEGEYLSDEKFNESTEKFSKHTLGRLIKGIKKNMEMDDDEIEALKLCLDERNYMIHEFFQDNGEKFLTIEGRSYLLERITKARRNIDPGYQIMDQITRMLMELSGINMTEIMLEVKSNFEAGGS